MSIPTMVRKALSGAAALGIAVCVCSCNGLLSPLSSAPRSDTQRDPRFPDVVAPAAFRLVKSDVAASEGRGHRDFILHYEGKLTGAEVVDFVREKYSVGNWVFEYSQTLGQRTFVDFRKGNERCSILVEQRRFKTILTIRVHEILE